LFLDALDECQWQHRFIASVLLDRLRKCPIDRLLFRISCRTADWPQQTLEDGLCALWKSEQVHVFTLAPLRYDDALLAAEASFPNASEFMREVAEREIEALAAKPLTLDFLLRIFADRGRLPEKQETLYDEGCRYLCAEQNPARLDAGFRGVLDAELRCAVASRIAAAMVFSGRSLIVVHSKDEIDATTDVSISELCGSTETVRGNEFPVTEAAIRDTLATSLFMAGPRGSLTWAHRTFAEFLAAKYLQSRTVAAPVIDGLLFSENRVVPQLAETAAWVAGMNPEIFQKIMETDPELLLKSDVATADNSVASGLDRELSRLAFKKRCGAAGRPARYRVTAMRRITGSQPGE
jgi:hypothetical protein